MTREAVRLSLRELPIEAIALTAYGEARNQPIRGVVAVMNVIMNRLAVTRWGTNAADVVLAKAQFSCWNTTDPNFAKLTGFIERGLTEPSSDVTFDVMRLIAARALEGLIPDQTAGALHYFNPRVIRPAWARPPAKRVLVVGDHEFYTNVAI